MSHINTSISNSTLEFHVVADDISGLSDGASVTTELVDRVASTASAVSSGDPKYVADAINGHAGVDFTRSNEDVLEWALSHFSTGIILIAYIAESDPSSGVQIFELGDGGSSNYNGLAHRGSGSNNHRYIQGSPGGGGVTAGGSSPAYGSLTVQGISRYAPGIIEWHYGGSSNREDDGMINSSFDSFSKVFVGGSAAFPGFALEGIILEVLVWSGGGSAVATRTDITRVMGDLADYYNNPLVTPPGTPTVSIDAVSETSVDASTSAFSPGEGGAHTHSQWQIRTDPGAVLVYDPGDDATNLISIEDAGSGVPLTGGTDYEIRARHKEDDTAYSEWSAWVSFTTATVTPPATPTVTVDQANETSVDASTSAFSAGEGGSHTHSQWQITIAADTGFASPVYDPGDDAVNLTSIDDAGPLTADTDYLIRVRHKEDNTTYSGWSAAVPFTTPAVTPPGAPTLSLVDKTDEDVALKTSAFVSGSGGEHADTQWQVAETADTGYASPVIDVTSTTELVNLFRAGVLSPSTGYRARARHRETVGGSVTMALSGDEAGGGLLITSSDELDEESDLGLVGEVSEGQWSAYSNEVTFTTDGAPDKPTISIVSLAGDHVVWSSSVYSGDAAQSGAHWQVTLHTDTGFASPIKDHETTAAAEFEDYTSFGLTPFTVQYIGRVRHLDENGVYSPWSDASSATSIVTDGQFYTAFAERPVGTEISGDVPSDWDEVWADDFSTWPIIEMADATCRVVVDRQQVEGDASAVDPIFWQGFPAVDQQEVFTRLKFLESGTGGSCASGEASPSGLICRDSVGLIEIDELDNLDAWRVARSGPFGSWDRVADRGHVDGSGAEQTGEHAIRFTHPAVDGQSPVGLIVWDGAGSLPVGTVFQVAIKYADNTGSWWDFGWPGIALGIDGDDDSFVCELPHACGLLDSRDYMAVYARLGGGLLGYSRGEHTLASYKYIKAQIGSDGVVRFWQAFPSRRGHGGAGTLAVGSSSYGAGKVGLATNRCQSDDAGTSHLFSSPTLYSSQLITINNLPAGWTFRVFHNSTSISDLDVTGDGSASLTIDLKSNAAPYDKIVLLNGDDVELETWEPDDVGGTAGIWGGDVYTITAGAVGVGEIGGPAARLTGTPGGADGQGYFLYLEDGQQLVLAKGDETGGLTTLDTFAYEHEPGVYYNLWLSANGTTIEGRVWTDAEGVPGAAQVSAADSDYASGAPGMVALSDTRVYFDVFAAGIGGDPYPTGRNPGTPTWLTPEVPYTVPSDDPVVHLSWARPPMTDDVLGGVVRYELQFQREGASGWVPLTIVSDQEHYDWDTTQLSAAPSYCVRVRALVGCEEGPWAERCGIGIEGVAAIKESPDGYFFGDWFTGEPDVGQWIRKFQASHLDDDLPVEACWITREFLPAGVGGEAVFKAAYLAVTVTTRTSFEVTPILDGDYLENEARSFTVSPSGSWKQERHEIPFSEPYDRANIERFRGGLRGSYLQLEICVTDTGGTGRAEVDGLAIDWSPARETHPWARPFAGELESDVQLERLSRFFFGTDSDDGLESAIYELSPDTSFDFGNRLTYHMESRPWAPAGPNGEVVVKNAYICITRSNEATAQIAVTPVMDGDDMETQEFTLEGVDQPLTEVLELPVSVPYERDGVERSRQGARGTWFHLRITNAGERPDGELVVNGAAIDMSRARETARDVALEIESPDLE